MCVTSGRRPLAPSGSPSAPIARPTMTPTATSRPAIEEFLSELGIGCFFAETHAIEGGRPVGKAADEIAIGPYAAIKRRYIIPPERGSPNRRHHLQTLSGRRRQGLGRPAGGRHRP